MRSKPVFAMLTATALAVGIAVVGAATAPVAAQTYYQPPPRPAARAHELRGIVTSFYRYDMSVNARGENVPVQLHPGTIIEPLGASLQPGMRVNLHGYWNNGVFVASRIVVR